MFGWFNNLGFQYKIILFIAVFLLGFTAGFQVRAWIAESAENKRLKAEAEAQNLLIEEQNKQVRANYEKAVEDNAEAQKFQNQIENNNKTTEEIVHEIKVIYADNPNTDCVLSDGVVRGINKIYGN